MRDIFQQPHRPSRPQCKAVLKLEELETREVPALVINIDYRFDTSGFFNDATRRNTLQTAANEIAARLDAGFGTIAPSGGNSWTATFFNPSTGANQTVSNMMIYQDTITIFVGGRDLSGTEAGVGGYGGWSASGDSNWVNYVGNRGDTSGSFTTWGGSISFDTVGTPWSFGLSSSVPSGTVDFYSVAQHEIGHVLGIGTSTQWFGLISNGTFHGGSAWGLYGSPVPVTSNGGHWADGTKGFGCYCPSCTGAARAAANQASLDPSTPYATRIGMSELDFAALRDLGWGVRTPEAAYGSATPPVTSPPVVPPVSPPPPPATPPTLLNLKSEWVAISGGGGTVQLFQQGSDGLIHPISGMMKPFSWYNGMIRSVTGDFNGDGVQDLAVATAAGPSATVAIYNGKDLNFLVAPTTVLGGFTGGAYLAAGDIDKDGNVELTVGSDVGSSRIQVFDVQNNKLYAMADFFAFNDPNFRGGVRVAMGDINKDGYADLVVTAGPGGGPRVATYGGSTLRFNQPKTIFNDFFAYDSRLRTGAYVAVGDLNGDGYSEIVFSADVGGGSRTIAYSGSLLTKYAGVDPMTLPFLFSQYATPENLPYGTRVTVKDLNCDGKDEMIFTTAKRTDSTIRLISSDQILSNSQPTNTVQTPLGMVGDLTGLYVG